MEIMRKESVEAAWRALALLMDAGVRTDKYTLSKMMKVTLMEKRRSPQVIYLAIEQVERFLDLKQNDVDEVLFNALLDACCRLKDMQRLESIVARMHALKVVPSPVTLGILVKTYGQRGDLGKVCEYWEQMENQRTEANDVTYGCMLEACVKCGDLAKAVEVFNGMRSKGKHRNIVLYTTLIKGYGQDKDLRSAMKLFREMKDEGVPYNTITYNSMIDVCVECNDLAGAEELLREMADSESAPNPDLISFSTLLKGYCHTGDLDSAFKVFEDIKARRLKKDELVFNTLMDGCAKMNKYEAGIDLFKEMLLVKLRPSAITTNILTRLCQAAGMPAENLYHVIEDFCNKHGLDPSVIPVLSPSWPAPMSKQIEPPPWSTYCETPAMSTQEHRNAQQFGGDAQIPTLSLASMTLDTRSPPYSEAAGLSLASMTLDGRSPHCDLQPLASLDGRNAFGDTQLLSRIHGAAEAETHDSACALDPLRRDPVAMRPFQLLLQDEAPEPQHTQESVLSSLLGTRDVGTRRSQSPVLLSQRPPWPEQQLSLHSAAAASVTGPAQFCCGSSGARASGASAAWLLEPSLPPTTPPPPVRDEGKLDPLTKLGELGEPWKVQLSTTSTWSSPSVLSPFPPCPEPVFPPFLRGTQQALDFAGGCE